MATTAPKEQKTNVDDNQVNPEFFMLTIKGLENLAQQEIQDLLQPISTRIIPGVIIATFNEISISLIKKMKQLRSVPKIIFLIGELSDLPLQQSNIQNYLQTNVLSLDSILIKKWKLAYECWKYSCLNVKLFINNPSIPFSVRNRFKKQLLNKANNNNNNNNKFHSINISLSAPVYRSECDRKGSHEWNSLLIEKELAAPLNDIFKFGVNLKYYDIEIFSYIRNNIFLYGISILSDLHIRNRKVRSHSTVLNNSICYLLGKLADINDNCIVFDPMCGLGSILIECKLAFNNKNNVKYIGTDFNQKAIDQAKINANYCNIKTNDNNINVDNNDDDDDNDDQDIDFKDDSMIEFYNIDIRELPVNKFKNESIDIIISDLPFGHKCGTHKANRKLYPLMLQSMNRVLKMNGKCLLLTAETKLLKRLLDEKKKEWKYDTINVDVGGLDAMVFIIKKLSNYTKKLKFHKTHPQIKTTNHNINLNDQTSIVINDNNDIQRKMSLDSQ